MKHHRKVRHVHARPNEWVHVHRNHGRSTHKGGGANVLGAIVLIVTLFAIIPDWVWTIALFVMPVYFFLLISSSK